MSIAERSKPSRKQHVRTLWISDVHLGTRDCQGAWPGSSSATRPTASTW